MMTIERDAIKLNGYVILIRPMCDETSNNCDIIKNRVASYKKARTKYTIAMSYRVPMPGIDAIITIIAILIVKEDLDFELE